MADNIDVKKVCQAHAEWFGDLLRTLVEPVAATFMEHGWKHGVDAAQTAGAAKPCGCPGGPIEHLMSCADPRFLRAEIERLAQQNAALETEAALAYQSSQMANNALAAANNELAILRQRVEAMQSELARKVDA